MAVKVIIGAKERVFNYNDTLPELDDNQISAGFTMADKGAHLLWSDPGAGKTLTAIHALAVVHEEYQPNPRVLIVCPNIAVRTWIRWIKQVYDNLTIGATVQYIDKSNRAVTEEADVLIVTYGTLSRKNAKLEAKLLDFNADVLLCDESDNLTGLDSARTEFVFGPKPHYSAGLAAKVRWAWLLTGTPIPRYNDGLFPVLKAKFADRLAAYNVADMDTFLNTFCTTETVLYGSMRRPKTNVNGSRQNKLLRTLLFGDKNRKEAPIASRIKLVLAERPAHKEITLYPKFSKEYLKLEEEVCNPTTQWNTAVENDEDEALGRYIDPRLATAFRMMGTESAPEVAAIVSAELQRKRAEGDNTGVLLLYMHKDVGDFLAQALADEHWIAGRIDGSTKGDDDAATEAAFNAGELDVVIGQIKSMGVALNLQENCDTVIFAEETFSDTANQQAYQRVWRRGQSRLVRVWWCRPLTGLADMKPSVAEKKRESAAQVLDANG